MSWDRLLDYYSMCIKHESAFANLLQRSASCKQYVFLRQAAEALISGVSPDLAVDDRIKNLAHIAVEKGETLYYGYPTVLIAEEHQDKGGRVLRRRKLGPLFLLEIGLTSLGQSIPSQLPVKSDSPFLHPEVFSRFGFKEEQLIALIDAFPIDPHLGSHEGLRVYLADLASELGIPITEKLDPAILAIIGEGDIEGFGLHNIAIIFRGRASHYHQRLLTEIRQLRGRWNEAKNTSAGLLISKGEASINSMVSAIPLCAPLQINESQRRALADAMSKRLTIVTGPPGTGKSQLVTNIVATAWMSRQSVLVASTNNQAVNVVCERAQKIWPGLIIRTGSREYRDSAKELLINLLGEQEAIPDNRALLSTLERNRNRLFELYNRIQKRSQIENRLAELFLGREHLAAHLCWQLENLPPSLSDRRLRRLRRQGLRVRNARILREWRTQRFLRALSLEHPDLLDEVVEFLNLEEEWRNLLKQERQFQAMD